MFPLQLNFLCLILTVAAPLTAAADQSQKISSETLRNDQLAVSGRYDRFERLLSQMADLLSREDPERAELLRRAISKGREKAISRQLGQIAGDLSQNNLGRALEQQDQVIESLSALLQLLQSEDRRSELEKERERLNRLLKDVSNTLSQQKSARASTQNSTAPSSSARDQQKAIDRADKILDDINSHDKQAGNTEDADSPDGDPKSADAKSAADDSSDSPAETSDAGQPSEGNTDPAETLPSDQGAKQSEQSPAEESGSQNSPSQNQGEEAQNGATPGQQNVAEARQAMQQALEKLQQQLREPALENQDEAIEALQNAVEELRKRLLQLREEEKEMVLASLEARFQRLLAAQTKIHDETIDLDATPVDQWLDTMFARSREVAQQQTELQVECEQTVGLLKEDGTSVAILLSVEDISIDMRTIAARLRDSKVSSLTQTLQTDIIEALKELIEATQREMQEMKSEERQQQPQPGDQQKPALVELMAEIKVLRSLQLRVNRRTLRIDSIMAEQTDDGRDDLIRQLEELTARQHRLVESAAELGARLSR